MTHHLSPAALARQAAIVKGVQADRLSAGRQARAERSPMVLLTYVVIAVVVVAMGVAVWPVVSEALGAFGKIEAALG